MHNAHTNTTLAKDRTQTPDTQNTHGRRSLLGPEDRDDDMTAGDPGASGRAPLYAGQLSATSIAQPRLSTRAEVPDRARLVLIE